MKLMAVDVDGSPKPVVLVLNPRELVAREVSHSPHILLPMPDQILSWPSDAAGTLSWPTEPLIFHSRTNFVGLAFLRKTIGHHNLWSLLDLELCHFMFLCWCVV